jgi:hypothetical protein
VGLEPTTPASKARSAWVVTSPVENGTGRGRCGVVRGCPLETGRDCHEWHGSGTGAGARWDSNPPHSCFISSTLAAKALLAAVCPSVVTARVQLDPAQTNTHCATEAPDLGERRIDYAGRRTQ